MLPGLKDALFLIDEREEIAMLTDPLGRSEEQVAAGTQGIVKCGNDAVLNVGAEID